MTIYEAMIIERESPLLEMTKGTDPSIILADEPTASLDSKRAFEVMEKKHEKS